MIETRPMTSQEMAARTAPPLAKILPSIAKTMAAHMIDIAAVNDGACRDADLLLRGFTVGEIAHHWAEANRIALGVSGEA